MIVSKALNHENIDPLLGYTLRESKCTDSLIFPWYKNGNLTHYLKCNPSTNRVHMVRFYLLEIVETTHTSVLGSPHCARNGVPPHPPSYTGISKQITSLLMMTAIHGWETSVWHLLRRDCGVLSMDLMYLILKVLFDASHQNYCLTIHVRRKAMFGPLAVHWLK